MHLFSRALFSVALIAFSIACGEPPTVDEATPATPTEQAILRGEASAEGEYPAVGVLLMTGKAYGYSLGSMVCTGTLIARDVVLLASHCAETDMMLPVPISDLKMYFSFARDVSTFGQTQGTPTLPEKTYAVTKLVQHPAWNAARLNTFQGGLTDFHDVALAFLAEPVSGIDPAGVMRPDDAARLHQGDEVEIVGYGQRTPEAGTMFSQPEAGEKFQAVSLINQLGQFEMQIGDEAPTPGKCHGDSGGPSFMHFDDGLLPALRVVGVTSHAFDQTDCAKGGVDTRVNPYWDWINETMISACADGVRTLCPNHGSLVIPDSRAPDFGTVTGGGSGGTGTNPGDTGSGGIDDGNDDGTADANDGDGGCAATGLSPMAAVAILGLLARRRSTMRA